VGEGGDEPNYHDLRDANFSHSDLPEVDLSCELVLVESADGSCGTPPEVACSQNPDEACYEPRGFDLSRVFFTSTDLQCADLEEAILTGPLGDLCESGTLECADLRSSNFSGTRLLGVDFRLVPVTGADFSRSTLRGSVFDGLGADTDPSATDDDPCYSGDGGSNPAPLCHSGETCVDFTDADLSGVSMQSIDFTLFEDSAGLPAIRFVERDLSGANFSSSRFSGFDLTRADFSSTVLSGVDFSGIFTTVGEEEELVQFTDLSEVDFARADFAVGARTNSDGTCSLPSSSVAADLRGADLVRSDFSRAVHFAEGCILVDETTVYDSTSTQFPALFTLQGEMTDVPEPRSSLLQIAALAAISLLARGRRRFPRR
jgi:uncharacterized protein YjbI with pentapeptide repeats